MLKRTIYLIAFLVCSFLPGMSQELVTYISPDKLTITADFYETEKDSHKWMLMFHQAEYSRGEYKEIARKMIKINYNCLAVDMRSGGEVNYVSNETATEAKNIGLPTTLFDCQKDILATIEYVKSRDKDAEIILFGSSFSASLCLLVAKQRPDIKAVIAFSPGEFFEPKIIVKNAIANLKIPVYAGCSKSEYNYVKDLLSKVKSPKMVIFKPEKGDGLHGAKNLWWESQTRNEFWLTLLFFLNNL